MDSNHEHASLRRWRQARTGLSGHQHGAERRAKAVFALTVITMLVELVAGWLTGSMALTADGWLMGSHAAALGISAFAYTFARRHALSERFSFGTGKVGALAGFSSALLLAVVAVLMAVESAGRLLQPVGVRFDEAIVVAVIGLAVNVASALLLAGPGAYHGRSSHDHNAGHGHRHPHVHHHDHNLRAAYLHVIADALTSVLAIAALLAGRFRGWVWLDPAVAIAASMLIGWWAWGLLRVTGGVLLDAEDEGALRSEIVRRIEADADNVVADLRLWNIGGESRALILSVATHRPRSAEHYKALLRDVEGLGHVTVEVFLCTDEPCDVHAGGAT
ncbi:MAG: CDF family Co(II)/Ni(II) efflux transporter DmeF [Betaproteobacteria bacterium]